MIYVCSKKEEDSPAHKGEILNPQLKALHEEYAAIFEEMQGLPPQEITWPLYLIDAKSLACQPETL